MQLAQLRDQLDQVQKVLKDVESPQTTSPELDRPQRKPTQPCTRTTPGDRFEAALRLAECDPARGAEALHGIVADKAFDPDTRSEAAHRLAEVDPARAAEALRSIIADNAFDPDTRSEAAHRLAEVGLA
jgi:hypothetical protein